MENNDEELVQRVKSGDMEAFEQLVLKYESRIYTIAYRYTGSHNDAGDLAQEAFIRAYKSIHGFRGESSFITWLSRVVTNVCKDELRRRMKQKTVSIDEMMENGHVPAIDYGGSSLEEVVLRKEWQQEVQAVLNTLSEEHRAVVIMRDIQGYSYEEISFMLKCSLGTVKSRLNRARNVLKDKLLASSEHGMNRTCQGV